METVENADQYENRHDAAAHERQFSNAKLPPGNSIVFPRAGVTQEKYRSRNKEPHRNVGREKPDPKCKKVRQDRYQSADRHSADEQSAEECAEAIHFNLTRGST